MPKSTRQAAAFLRIVSQTAALRREARLNLFSPGALLCAAMAFPAAAQPGQTGVPASSDIIVTGERLVRDLRETSSSVAVFEADAIDAAAAVRLDELLAHVPNVQLGSGEEGPAIRGQDSTGQLRNLFAFLGGARPRVTLQVDGRPLSYYEFVSGTEGLWDLERIEIFRSPQTTTQGRNAIAGGIFIETRDPAFNWEATGRLSADNAGAGHVSALLSGPMVGDEMAFRLAGDLRLGRTASDMADAIAGADIDRDDYGTARLKLLLEPKALPGARIETTLVHARSQSPQFEGVTMPFKSRQVPIPDRTIGIMRVRSTSATARAHYAISAAAETSATISYGDIRLRRFGLAGLGNTLADSSDVSGEAIVIGHPRAGLRLLGGIHRLAANQAQFIDIRGLGIGTGNFEDRQDSLGLFGELEWRPAGRVIITAGGRYQQDRQQRKGAVGAIMLDYDRTFRAFLPKLSLAYSTGEELTAGVMLQRAFNPGGTSISLVRRAEDSFEAERLWNTEIFLRTALGRGKGLLSLNAFFNDITDAQRQQLVPITLPGGGTMLVPEFANAPRARSYGVEASLSWQPVAGLTLTGGAGFLATRTVRTLAASDPTRGKRFQRSPSFSGSGAIDWHASDSLRVSAQIRHQSGYYSDDANGAARRIGATTIVDTRAALRHGKVTLFAYARNLFNDFYLTYLFTPSFGSAGDPREVGIGIETFF